MITKIEILKKKHIVQSEHSVALQENYGINAESTYIWHTKPKCLWEPRKRGEKYKETQPKNKKQKQNKINNLKGTGPSKTTEIWLQCINWRRDEGQWDKSFNLSVMTEMPDCVKSS